MADNPESPHALVNVDIKLGKRAEETACQLLKSLLGSAAKNTGHLLGDQVAYWKWCNTVRLANKVANRMKRDGVAARAVAPSFLVPLLEAAATTDDESIQDMWAALLTAGVADDNAQRRSYTETLKSLGKAEAELLLRIAREGGTYDTKDGGGTAGGIPAARLLKGVGLLTPVVRIGARDAGRLNTVAFGADLTVLEVSDYAWDFLGCVEPTVTRPPTAAPDQQLSEEYHIVPRAE